MPYSRLKADPNSNTGGLHWISGMSGAFYAFDLGNEQIRQIPVPLGLGNLTTSMDLGVSSVSLFWFAGSAIWSAPISDVLSLYPGRLSSRTVSTIAGRISLKDSESNLRLDLFPLLFCNLLAWKHSDFLCKNYILNGLDNALYNVYSPMVNAKALWESLERKYKTEDAGSKKFVVGKFLDFKMVDSKTVISQVQEFQLILHDIHAEGMVLGESFQVAALIEKLPPTWKDFKNYLKHKRKEMKLEDLIVRLRIEEDNRQSEKKAGNYHQEAKANVVEQAYAYTGRFLALDSAGIGELRI
ncbi:hypothetical protein RJ639_040088 [Escallonia herrerae]|uniref:Uncharacterized protein n=1 Tax=Escallonia herrerae TaxID=1293975 RepID=A0AA88WJR4_9ASTE|nr:hypothetical protein RJ639_040088 [Escallonia herrerae]